MNTEKKKLITAEGLKGLSEELEYLKVVRRKEIAEKIKDARDQGDLTENDRIIDQERGSSRAGSRQAAQSQCWLFSHRTGRRVWRGREVFDRRLHGSQQLKRENLQ